MGAAVILLLPQTAVVRRVSSLLLTVKRLKCLQTASIDCTLMVVTSSPENDVIARRLGLALVSALFTTSLQPRRMECGKRK